MVDGAMPSRLKAASDSLEILSPFRRLAALLQGIEPAMSEIDLTIGEPRHPMPPFLADRLNEHMGEFAKYPPILGTDALRQAITGWLRRRYPTLRDALDADRHILPLCGSREGLFSAIFAATARKSGNARPTVLLPNPFYFAYAAAASAAQAEAIYLNTPQKSGFLPDLEAIDAGLLDRAAAFYLASPSNPQGAAASETYLERLIGLARKHDFLLFADECYSEIYCDAPPTGALAVAQQAFGDFSNVLSFQSLSKRSNLPGLRSGFCAGDPAVISAYGTLRNVSSPQMPLPIQAASAAVWADEAHVEQSRALYGEKFAACDRILGDRFGYRRPQGGFFLWLDVESHGGGVEMAKTLWKACGIKLLPGAYLAHAAAGASNPGDNHVRLALVDSLTRTETALERMVAWAEGKG